MKNRAHIQLRPNVDQTGGMPELAGREPLVVHSLTITSLENGTEGGNPSVALIVDLPDGRYLFCETTLALLLTAADTLRAVHGDPRTGTVGRPAPRKGTN